MGLLWCFFLSGNDKKTFQMFQMIIKELYRTLGQMGGGGVIFLESKNCAHTLRNPMHELKGK